jgi:hypothetical protein
MFYLFVDCYIWPYFVSNWSSKVFKNMQTSWFTNDFVLAPNYVWNKYVHIVEIKFFNVRFHLGYFSFELFGRNICPWYLSCDWNCGKCHYNISLYIQNEKLQWRTIRYPYLSIIWSMRNHIYNYLFYLGLCVFCQFSIFHYLMKKYQNMIHYTFIRTTYM